MRNKRGPKIEPWGIPNSTLELELELGAIHVVKLLSHKFAYGTKVIIERISYLRWASQFFPRFI